MKTPANDKKDHFEYLFIDFFKGGSTFKDALFLYRFLSNYTLS